ncbi:MAG: site-specific integrase [Chloroflexi bacterium]|nr:site-specific integrase [Chloroflexota bacterium]
MIHRQNYLDMLAYLRHCERARQQHPDTVDRARGYLRHMLEWADETPWPQARRIDPVYPAYLVQRSLAPATIGKALGQARHFFGWARDAWPTRYRAVGAGYTSLLIPPRGHRLDSRIETPAYYTLDDVRRLLAVSAETLREERTQAAAALLFLSGMRDGAFVTMPLSCVDVTRRELMQTPERGVHTKNGKAARTYLLEIPDLLDVAARWDARLRAEFPAESLWYASIHRDGARLLDTRSASENRAKNLRDDLTLLCQKAGIPYLSPHKFRHGHVVYARQSARNMDELKAVSQNVMHESVVITDSIYGRLMGDSVKNTIARLGAETQTSDGLEAKIDELLQLLRQKG